MARQTWVISDTHYGHAMLVERGFRPANFQERMLAGFMANFKPGDTVIHLGDWYVSAHGKEVALLHLKIIKSLVENGSVVLVRGNHDEESLTKYSNLGWDAAVDGMTIETSGMTVKFSHKPAPLEYFVDAETRCPVPSWHFNIHGHLHGNDHREGINDGRHIEIAQELLNYHPVPLDTVLKLKSTPVYKNGKFVSR